jgi:hypothetical protein
LGNRRSFFIWCLQLVVLMLDKQAAPATRPTRGLRLRILQYSITPTLMALCLPANCFPEPKPGLKPRFQPRA